MTSTTGDHPPIRVLTTTGLTVLTGLSDTEASSVGAHWNAIRRYLESGDDSALARFVGVRVGAASYDYFQVGFPDPGVELETDLDAIEREAFRGDTGFESIYES